VIESQARVYKQVVLARDWVSAEEIAADVHMDQSWCRGILKLLADRGQIDRRRDGRRLLYRRLGFLDSLVAK
jgi:predicted transcriptional regulator